jgi:hypothetical protein
MAKKTVIVYTYNGATIVKKYDTISNAVSMLTTIKKTGDMALVSVTFPDWYKLPEHSTHLIQMGA